MADKNLLSQMLEHLVNDDSAKAEELFHEYVVAASREIYEGLIESELQDEEVEEATDEEDEDKVDEASEEDKDDDEDLDENFEGFGEEEGGFGGDATDDLDSELDAGDEMDGEEGEEKGEEELFQDLEAIVDELQAKFDELKGIEGEEHGDADFGDEGDDMPEEEGFELSTVREYVEKVPAGHGAEKKGGAEGQLSGTGSKSDKPSVNAKSLIDNMKNDMGGTTANILSSKEEAPTFAGAAGGQLKGSGLLKGTPKEDNAGNINVPGGKAGSAFSKKEPGHGAEKKGEAEGKFSGAGGSSGSVDKASLFRGRR